ncbi:hypothetical protein SLEP1_g14591 [Rubroshorea leprosula]|uniref:Glycosyl transferase family 1 domain-containing protein n=1 Tax=Rubroshorea leprosula TaxID=152421 RepID=A0AAV5IU16_9ROSI|nr:hypothetical protein SLEP1_g14591 [Rubroshorea leprosula]
MADMILVNNRCTASTFANTFRHLHAKGIRPSILYPTVNVDQFGKLNSYNGYDKRLRENVEYLEELKSLAERGVANWINMDEHFGIVSLEAMVAHKPVIACNSNSPIETVKNGVTGFLCDPTADDFALAMAKFVQDL